MSANGRLSATEIVEVEPDIYLEPATARDYWRWRTAARARGYAGFGIARPAGGYRSFEMQQDMHLRPWLYNLNTFSSAKIAPAGQSRHGYGRAVDIVGAPEAWVRATMTEFGFHLWSTKDPNHYEHGTALALSGFTTADFGVEEDDLFSDTDRKLLEQVHQTLYNNLAVQIGRIDKNAGEVRQAIYSKAEDGPGSWDGLAKVLGDVLSLVRDAPTGTVDVTALAEALAPLLSDPVLPDGALDSLAQKVNDEADRRARERLG